MSTPDTAPLQPTPAQEVTTPPAPASPLLEEVLKETGYATRTERQRDTGKNLILRFVDEVLKGGMVASRDTQTAIAKRIEQIDSLVARQTDEFLHDSRFQQLEATWRGLRYLMDRTETGDKLKLKVFNVSKQDLSDSFKTDEVDQSPLYKKVYQQEYGQAGGEPFAVLVGDYRFDNSDPDLAALERVAGVAAAAHAPFIAAADPGMFNMKSFEQLTGVRDLASIFRTPDYARWRAFRDSRDAQYVALTVPGMLMRLPYDPKNNPVEGLNYREHVDGRAHTKYLWGNAAYALGALMTQAFARNGWASAIVGPKNAKVDGLPTHTFQSLNGDVVMKSPTEVDIVETRDRELEELGFAALVHYKNENYATFFGVPSCQKPKTYNKPEATASAFMSSQLPYTMAVTRFAHYLKIMVRDYIGSHLSRSGCELLLNEWISGYVDEHDDSPESVKLEKPLREARVEVQDVPGKPGYYRATAYLRPHYQLKGMAIAMKLVADLPKPVAERA